MLSKEDASTGTHTTHDTAVHQQDWQPYPANPYSAGSADHTNMHTYNTRGQQRVPAIGRKA